MKILFQVLFFLGVFSFLGGLMNGVFFIIGIIIAVIFGYLGFIHKEKDNRNIVNRKETGDYNKKIELLQKAFDNGVLNQAEFEKKKIELFALNLDQEDERNKEEKRKILDDLLRKGLVNQSEYDKKIGADRLLTLHEEAHKTKKFTREELKEIIAKYKKKLK